MRDYIAVVVGRLQAAPGMVVAAIVAATISTVMVMAGLASSAIRPEEPYLQMLHVSGTTPVTAGGTYSYVRVAVDNGGTATAHGCYAKAYNHLLFSNEIDKLSPLGRSEQFNLSPYGGYVATVSVYLPDLSGEALLGGGLRAPVFFRVECENAESSEEGKTVKVSGPASGLATP